MFSARSWRAFGGRVHRIEVSLFSLCIVTRTDLRASEKEENVSRGSARYVRVALSVRRVSRTRKMLPCKATTKEAPLRNCQEDRRRRGRT